MAVFKFCTVVRFDGLRWNSCRNRSKSIWLMSYSRVSSPACSGWVSIASSTTWCNWRMMWEISALSRSFCRLL